MGVFLLAALGCSGGGQQAAESEDVVTVPSPPLPPSPPAQPSAPDAMPAPAEVVAGGPVHVADELAEIRLGFDGVGPLHQGFFKQERFVLELGEALAVCGAGPHELLVSYDTARRIGHIELVVEPGEFGCLPTRTDEGWDLAALRPVGVALAAYRDAVAGAYDYRVASFRGGIRYLRGVKLCSLQMGGQYPPDGTTWSRCVKFAGNEVCGVGDPEVGVLVITLGAEHADYLSACFSP